MKKVVDKKQILLFIIFIIYLITSFFIMINHEVWADETQAWQIAKNLSIPEMINQMKYEAHPCLWHIIISIPAKLGLPVMSMNIISWLFISIAVYIILFHSKFNIFLKILIIFNPTFIYYSSAIARNYSLIVLFLALFSYTYDKRFKHPILYTCILGFLAHTHIIICGFVGIATISFLIETLKKKEYKQTIVNLIILIIFFILLAVQIFPALETCIFINKIGIDTKALAENALSMGRFFLIDPTEKESYIIIISIFIITTIITFINNKQKGLIYFITVLIFYLIQLKWPFAIDERTCILFALMIFLNFDNKKLIFTIFTIIISILIYSSNIEKIYSDIKYGYSDSKNTGTYINENIEDNSLIIILDADRHTSAISYIEDNKNIKLYNIKNDNNKTFITWNYETRTIDKNMIIEKLNEVKEQYDNIYLLYGTTILDPSGLSNMTNELVIEIDKMIPVYSTELVGQSGEIFAIFRYIK